MAFSCFSRHVNVRLGQEHTSDGKLSAARPRDGAARRAPSGTTAATCPGYAAPGAGCRLRSWGPRFPRAASHRDLHQHLFEQIKPAPFQANSFLKSI